MSWCTEQLQRSHCFLIFLFFKVKFTFEISFEQCFEVECSSQMWVILMLIYYTTMCIIKGQVNDSSSE